MEKRLPGFLPLALGLLMVASVLATLALLPLWHCPFCDGEAWDKAYPGTGKANAVRTEPATCDLCNRTGRMNFYQKWSRIRDFRRVNINEIPLFH